MNRYYRNALVGLLCIIGVVLFIGASLWLRGKTLGGRHFMVVYNEIGNLKEGAPVRISGAPIGRVDKIEFVAPGKIAVQLKIDVKEVRPTANARASIGTVGMLGDAVIDLAPGTGQEIGPTDTLIGAPAAPGLFDIAGTLAGRADTTLRALQRMLDTNLVVDLRRTLRRSDEALAYFADPRRGPTAEVNATMQSLQVASARLDSTLRNLDVKSLQAQTDSTMRSARALTNRLTSLSGRMDTLMGRIQRGEGTLGKLASDTMLYVDLRHTMQSVQQLVDEIKKNPGKIGVTVRIP